MNKVDDIIVVGGGNAGYISALILKQSFPYKSIKIIESKSIGTIGVGESSSEQFAQFCSFCNISSLDLILRAKATFKNGIYFKDWSNADYLHHVNTTNCAASIRGHYPYMQSVVVYNKPNYEMNPCGTWINQVPLYFFNDLNNSPTNQFHFDTHALNEYLRELCIHRGIKVIEDKIVSSDLYEETGNLRCVTGRQKYYADFFIDCSGFSRLLLGKTLDVKWKSYSDYLPLNSAITFSTDEMEEYNMYTKATARDYGWSWEIPTQDSTGNGYVFSDKFINEDKAQQEMENVYGKKLDIGRTFKFDPGRLETSWQKNCFAVGLSQSFVEPLEATAIGSVINQMLAFVHHLPSNDMDGCNKVVNNIFDNIFDYVQAHYLVKREDTPFWKEVKYNLKLTSSLKSLLSKWEKRFPLNGDVLCRWGLFTEANYIPILYGLKWFNREVIEQEYTHISHLPIVKWEETYPNTIHLSHKQLIKESVKTYNLNNDE